MRTANLGGRLAVIVGDRAVDVARASEGRFPADPQAVFAEWDAFARWGGDLDAALGRPFDPEELGPPVPRPAQVFAIGINYAEHAREAGYPPESPPVTFTKFPSCLAGPVCEVELPTGTVDWEVEAVVALSRPAFRVSRQDAWDHVAGITLGQDLSERTSQLAGAKPQFSLAKSFPGFGPTGPWLVTPDEFDDPGDLAISCSLSGEVVQSARTSAMIYDIPELVFRLSHVCRLYPGDLIFTGTPPGVGNARSPKRFLRPGEVLVSELEGVGSITQRFTAPRHGPDT
ncbi:2-keto-4-pentenoate hydratase/2-oxohepta-3-ene-1,7-dioic acid hydratase (catechol pathway) [Thermomonospora echinospora]|uniref:2-keto-4-pentenoate hydratase/2-oxohepta-3-ene-1,7-dioic acid hydratase (Catechol pathway) n=1 Tax=Thermomonospora echinospora TaxID=1992 RepID=A0A1H6CRR2_9ACTN|nr:fumarylacetoacetate hydrolase family protein [Thermomonospora echinospora]SEG75315.1 2-keto-4-pentenoate hydratase/2-oxohepta-3-ene-1,7-dioic acid hydratase (catechol pathway) [Thermomonospora echinospora]